MRKVRYAIVGAGTVGLTALSIIKKQTDDYLLIQSGEFGTTCARVGCMPSKALIHAANHFYHAQHADAVGVLGGAKLSVDQAFVMQRVRRFRDRFTTGIKQATTDGLSSRNLLLGKAKFVAVNRLDVDGELVEADRIIIGTGSSPIVPSAWRDSLGDRLLTSDNLFELDVLPKRIAVIGLGVIGLELGQSLSRLGVEVIGFEASDKLGGLRYAKSAEKLFQLLSEEFPIYLDRSVEIEADPHCARVVRGAETFEVDAVLVTIGRKPNLADLNLTCLGIDLNDQESLLVNPNTLQLEGMPVFLAGDASGYRPILHEAGDEGKIAALNALAYPNVRPKKRKTALGISFIEPGVAYFGDRLDKLNPKLHVVADFDLHCNNGRAIVMDQDQGLITLFADKQSGRLLGGELIMPQAEHLAHLLAWCVEQELTVSKILDMPFYHPVLEEAVESVLKQLKEKLQ